MGFIPLPLSVVIIRVIGSAVKGDTTGTIFLFLLGYLCLVSLRILCSIIILGKACDLIDQHQNNKRSASITSLSSRDTQNKGTNNQTVAVTKNTEQLSTPTKSPTNDTSNNVNFQQSPNSLLENFTRQSRKNEEMNKIPLPCYLSGSASPINTKSKEATSKDLKDSAILLENKIEALFGKNRGVILNDGQNKTPLNATSDGIFFATEYVGIEHKASCIETNAEQCVFETTSNYKDDSDRKLEHTYQGANQSIELIETSSPSALNSKIYKLENELNEASIIQETDENKTTIHSSLQKGDMQLPHSNDSTVSKKLGVKTNETEHIGWSKRRSQLLAAKQAQTDSRRRPLSCTPPSTSIDQSSIDEEEDSLSISLHTASYSSSVISSSTTSTNSNDKVSANINMKHADSHGFCTSPSSSFEGLTTTNLENENISVNDELNESSRILRANDLCKPDQIVAQRDTALKSIAEKENENVDGVETFNPARENFPEGDLPDICQQEQAEQVSPTTSCAGEKFNDSSMEE